MRGAMASVRFKRPETFRIVLTPSELDVVSRPIVTAGGHQNLLKKCLQTLHGDTMTLSAQLLDKVAKYAYGYGEGGFQGRFRTILTAALRAGWTEGQAA